MLDVPDGTPDRGPGLLKLVIVCMVLVILTVALRIVSKITVRQYWWWDDFFAILALPIELTCLGIFIHWIEIGLGYHMSVVEAINPELAVQGAKHLYLAIFFFDSSVQIPKLSALFFYARVFRTGNKWFTINLWIAGSLVSGWLVSTILSTIWQCTPIERAWNPTIPGTCINTYQWYFWTALISCITDFYILLLPIPMIWRLNAPLIRRVQLLAAFFCAYSVIVLSIGRLVYTVTLVPTVTEDLDWNMTPYLYWASLEGTVSLISVCIPNIAALVKHIMARRREKTPPDFTKGPSVYGGGTFVARTKDRDGFERLTNSKHMHSPNGTEAASMEDGEIGRVKVFSPVSGAVPDEIALGRIHVQTDISVKTSEV